MKGYTGAELGWKSKTDIGTIIVRPAICLEGKRMTLVELKNHKWEKPLKFGLSDEATTALSDMLRLSANHEFSRMHRLQAAINQLIHS